MRLLNKFAPTLCLFSLWTTFGQSALAQQDAPVQQSTVAQDVPGQVPTGALKPAAGKPAEAVPAKPANGWRAVSTRQPGEALLIKLRNGSTLKGTLKSASNDSLVLDTKKKEVRLEREEIASVAVVNKKSAAKATLLGVAIGGGAGAGIGAATVGKCTGLCPISDGQARALGAAIVGTAGAIGGGLIGYFSGRGRHKETLLFEAAPTH
jgi:small nuclear ribonucleoprotein (snRNP)-like protein